VFQHGDVGQSIIFCDANPFAEVSDGFCGNTTSSESRDGWHAGIIPSGNVLFLHER
jgi:hypothetical protein